MTDEELIARLRNHATDVWHYAAADRIDAQAAEIERLVKERDAAVHLAHMRKTFIEEARDERDAREAKLAKAVESLGRISEGESWQANEARDTLAELTGDKT